MKLCKLRGFLPQALWFIPRTIVWEELCKLDQGLCKCPGAGLWNASAKGYWSYKRSAPPTPNQKSWFHYKAVSFGCPPGSLNILGRREWKMCFIALLKLPWNSKRAETAVWDVGNNCCLIVDLLCQNRTEGIWWGLIYGKWCHCAYWWNVSSVCILANYIFQCKQ